MTCRLALRYLLILALMLPPQAVFSGPLSDAPAGQPMEATTDNCHSPQTTDKTETAAGMACCETNCCDDNCGGHCQSAGGFCLLTTALALWRAFRRNDRSPEPANPPGRTQRPPLHPPSLTL